MSNDHPEDNTSVRNNGAFQDTPWPSDRVREYIFSEAGYRTERVIMPTRRMIRAVTDDMIDLASSVGERPPLIKSRLPIATQTVRVYYRKSLSWTPVWPPQYEFKIARGVTKDLVFLEERWLDNLQNLTTYQAAVLMVNNDRADYWIEVIRNGDARLKGYVDYDKFRRTILFIYGDFTYFADTTRGRMLRDIHDNGLEMLLQDEERHLMLWAQDQDAMQQIGISESDLLEGFKTYRRFLTENYQSAQN